MYKAAPRHALMQILFAAGLACGQIGSGASAIAATLQIKLTGADHRPVAGAVATATFLGATPPAPRERKTAIMDQLHKAFVPQLLVIAAGTAVDFPNSDSVSHQVYSFSSAKKFQLSLYKGERHAPVQFDKPGLVVLGCNIHDSMVGYIYVADTPYFGQTDASGSVRLDSLPRGRYRVQLWSPNIADDANGLNRDLELSDGAAAEVSFALRKALRLLPEPRPRPEGWDAY